MPDQFKVNFGDAKEIVQPPEGNYTLIVSSYQTKQAAKEESRSKGFNISLRFKIDDPDYSDYTVYHNIWVHYENPFGAKEFFDALTGKDLEDDSLDLGDADLYVGESVGAFLKLEHYTANNGDERTKLSPEKFYSV